MTKKCLRCKRNLKSFDGTVLICPLGHFAAKDGTPLKSYSTAKEAMDDILPPSK